MEVQTERGRGVIYSQLEEMMERADEGGRERVMYAER